MKVISLSVRSHSVDADGFYAEIEAITSAAELNLIHNSMSEEIGICKLPFRRNETAKCKANFEVIFNPPYTILNVNGNKYISKAHNEEFDEEKGLLMCLVKAGGITHLNLKRMLKGAKRVGKTSP